jgi:hypothetical protein
MLKRPKELIQPEMWVDYGPKRKVLIKLTNAWFSYGDKIVEFNEDDPESIKELEDLLRSRYNGIQTLIMDLFNPDETIGRHAFDIRTTMCPDGTV